VQQPVLNIGNISNETIGNDSVSVSENTSDVVINIPEGTEYRSSDMLLFYELRITSEQNSIKQFSLHTDDGDLGNIKFTILDTEIGPLTDLTKDNTSVDTTSFKDRLFVVGIYNTVANEAVNKTFKLSITEK
jgi:hypothetical protein